MEGIDERADKRREKKEKKKRDKKEKKSKRRLEKLDKIDEAAQDEGKELSVASEGEQADGSKKKRRMRKMAELDEAQVDEPAAAQGKGDDDVAMKSEWSLLLKKWKDD